MMVYLEPALAFSFITATLGTNGWLDLVRQGLSPCKKRQASLGALAVCVTPALYLQICYCLVVENNFGIASAINSSEMPASLSYLMPTVEIAQVLVEAGLRTICAAPFERGGNAHGRFGLACGCHGFKRIF